MAERPTPESTDPVLEAVVGVGAARRRGRRPTTGSAAPGRSIGRPSPVGSNSGSHTSSCCSKRTATSWPMCTSSGSQPTTFVVSRTSASSSRATIAITYGGGERRASHGWALTVSRPPWPGRTPVRLPRPAAARRADRHGRVHEGAAVGAALDAELPVGARRPEPAGCRGELGERPHPVARAGAMTCGRSTVVRMPGAAAHDDRHRVDRPVGGVAGRRLAHALERDRERAARRRAGRRPATTIRQPVGRRSHAGSRSVRAVPVGAEGEQRLDRRAGR